MLFDDWANHPWPEERFLSRCICHELTRVDLGWTFRFHHSKVTKLLIHNVFLFEMTRKNTGWVPLSQLTKVTPGIRCSGHGTLLMVRTGCHYISFVS